MSAAPFGDTTLYPTFTVEAGFTSALSAGFGIWDTAVWDTDVWGPDIAFIDITGYVYTVDTNRGRVRETDRFTTGVMKVTLKNHDDRFSPLNLAGPYVVGGVTQIRPGVPIRVTATWASVTYPIFYGYVDDWADSYEENGKYGTTTVTVVDALSLLAAFDGLEQSETGAGELAGARIARIANSAGFPGALDLDAGYNTMQATALAQNALTEAGLTADSDGGLVWADGSGALVFRDQFAAITRPRSNTSQFTFGTDVGIAEPQPTYDASLIFNTLSFARAGGSAVSTSDTDSQALYKQRTYRRFDLICETTDQVTDLMNFFLARFKDPESRIRKLDMLSPGTAAAAAVTWPLVLGALFRDRVTVAFTAPGGTAMSQELFIEAIAHRIDVNSGWSMRFGFGSTAAYDIYADFGYWDSGVWDETVWLP